jgi:hypothetical protein
VLGLGWSGGGAERRTVSMFRPADDERRERQRQMKNGPALTYSRDR